MAKRDPRRSLERAQTQPRGSPSTGESKLAVLIADPSDSADGGTPRRRPLPSSKILCHVDLDFLRLHRFHLGKLYGQDTIAVAGAHLVGLH